ncbi:RIP metalloprotease RseP [Thermobrachium celere]|uniref:Zinc metalloprotease n=1 Tax=Thermobrachium celere DSM 8682 TaxID=941824 RepID=R7RPF8_9CLOT|nr:RIP metalloprotease RseP [Thermobrachium celere]GFR35825.1 zinc metalloprotease [Thermobrachium celere]CDF57944.1 Membrane-associated zinc metalloprotease [Thermobrachium celere DSM 8682]
MQTFLATVFVFGLLVTSHELGHFITAKLAGIKVLEFAIGMGPKLFGFKKGETNYSLRILPLGGYVKMLGEEGESNDPRAFCNQSPWIRLIVIVAGAFMNFVIAVILFAIIAMNTGIVKPIISEVEKGYPAYNAGIKVNDVIIAVNGKKVKMWEDFVLTISENKDKQINLTIKRDNVIKEYNIKPVYDESRGKYLIGIVPTVTKGNLIEAIGDGFNKTIFTTKQMGLFLKRALRGQISSEDVGGPVAIVKMSGEAARYGLLSLLSFAALLSINLGVINLIPFPALDGGWVIILLFEGITGRKIDENKIGLINLIGFTILILFAIFITYKDIIRFKLL